MYTPVYVSLYMYISDMCKYVCASEFIVDVRCMTYRRLDASLVNSVLVHVPWRKERFTNRPM